MLEQMEWSEVYLLWQRSMYYFPMNLASPLATEKVFVDYKKDGSFYGYDWLENSEANQRKKIIETDLSEFLYWTKPTNKGTIQTARMLSEAIDEEERAAIWIVATAFELKELQCCNHVSSIAYRLYHAAWSFLQERFYMWHHAMKKLVPDIVIPYTVIERLSEADSRIVMQLIQMNTLMIKGNYSILLYSSFEDDEKPKGYSLRKTADIK